MSLTNTPDHTTKPKNYIQPTMSTTRHAMETARSKPAAGASKAAGISSRSTFYVGGSASYRMHNGENVPLNSSRPGSSRRVNESQNSRVVFGTNVGTAGGEVAPYRETSHVSQRKQSELYESVNIFGKDNKKTMNRFHKVPSQKVRDLDGTNAAIPHVVENRAAAVAATPVETPSSSARPSPPASTVDEIPASKPVPAAMREEIETLKQAVEKLVSHAIEANSEKVQLLNPKPTLLVIVPLLL